MVAHPLQHLSQRGSHPKPTKLACDHMSAGRQAQLTASTFN